MTRRERVVLGVKLWLYRRRLLKCPSCLGARMVHYFGGGEFAELRRCWTCTGSNDYLAETKVPCVTWAEPEEQPTTPHLRAVS